MAANKRQHQLEEFSDSKENERRTRARHEAGHIESGNLDLNAVPKGFDLNAPMIEELEDAEIEMNSQLEMDTHVGQESQKSLHEQQHESPVTSSIAYRQLDPVTTLGINEDLDILYAIWSAYERQDIETLDCILAGSCEELAKNPFNCSRYHYLTCIYVSKKLPEVFSLQKTFKVVMSFFSSGNFHTVTKKHLVLPVLASKLLLRAFEPISQWPLDFVRIYLEDAVGLRGWIDHDGCKEFVTNIVTAFCDAPTEGAQKVNDFGGHPRSPVGPEGQTMKSEAGNLSYSDMGAVKNRYPNIDTRGIAREEFLKAVQFLLESSSTKENLRQLLKLLMQGVGYEEVRVLGSSMLESWLNNPIHLRAAKALLGEILENLHGVTENDIITVANLLALRVQSLQTASQIKSLHGNIYTEMITHLVSRRQEYASLALKTFVIAEINGKSLLNMRCIAIVLKAMPVSSPAEHELAAVLQEQAVNADTRLQLQEFGRRLLKHMGQDLNVHSLCHGLLQPWAAMVDQAESLKDGWLTQLVDLACQLLLHGVSHLASDESFVQTIKDSARRRTKVLETSAALSSSREKFSLLEKFSGDMAAFQVDAMEWCANVLITFLPRISSAHFKNVVQKFLFLEDYQAYFSNGESCGDLEFNSFQLLSSCTRASEEILARLILMGISNDFPMTQAESLQIIEMLVWRAAASTRYMSCALEAESSQLPEAILKLASLNLPGLGPQPSLQLVLKDLYWRACLVVLLIAVNNVQKLGKYVWESIPTVQRIMEALLTCSRDFVPLSYDEGQRKESEGQELEASEEDKKTEEAIAAFMLEHRVAESAGSQDCMQWRGNVMYVDHSVRSRKPPPSAIKEIDKAEELYQLGQMLWKCREPDFFVQVTASQTLSRAWLWLQKVLAKEPELVKRLPLLWQVELLYVYEGFHPANQRYSMDLSHLYTSLNMAVTQDYGDNVQEVEAIIDFLVNKLASMECYVRSRARRCFAGILDPSCLTQVVIAKSDSVKEDLHWLELFDAIPTGKRLLEKVCPAICRAIQRENSTDVVVAYLIFLKGRLPSSPSPLSLAHTVTLLCMHRRMLTASLLQKSQRMFMSATGISSPFSQISQPVADIFIEALREALEFGILSSSDASTNLPNVNLVLPCYQQDRKVTVFSRKNIQKAVVDAAIEVLALLSSEHCELSYKHDGYERIIHLLFPGFAKPQEHEIQFFMAWLEDSSGNELPLLSESQARALARTKDARLVQAGLSILDNSAKMEVCASLGLSSTAITAFIGDLASIANTRSTDQFKEGSYVSKIRNGWKQKELINLVAYIADKKGSGASPKALPQNSVLDTENEAETSGMEDWIPDVSLEDILLHSVPLHPSRNFLTMYLQFRRYLQEVNLCSAAQTRFMESEVLLKGSLKVENKCWQEPASLRLQLPILISLGGCKDALTHLLDTEPECASASRLKHLMHLVFESIEAMPYCAFVSGAVAYKHVYTQAGQFVQEMGNFLMKPFRRHEPCNELAQQGTIEKDSTSADIQTEGGLLTPSILTHENAESYMSTYSGWEGKHAARNDLLPQLMDNLSNLGQNQDLKVNVAGVSDKLFGFNGNIARAGISSLFVGFMTFLNANVVLEDYLIQQLESLSISAESCTQMPTLHLMLGWALHSSSWGFATKTLQCLLKAIEPKLNGRKRFSFSCEKEASENVSWEGFLLLNHLLSLGAVLEFTNGILCNTRAQLASWKQESPNIQDSIVNIAASVITPATAKVICTVAILVSATCSVLSRRDYIKNENEKGTSLMTLQAEMVMIKKHCHKYEKVAVTVLICVARHNASILRTIINELWDRGKTASGATLDYSILGNTVLERDAKMAAKKLLWRLYTIWPISVESALPSGSFKEFLTSDFPISMDIFLGEDFSLGQTSSLRATIHQTVMFTLRQSVDKNDAACRFCKTFARQHSAFFLYSIPALGVLLKELIPMIKTEDPEGRKHLARGLSMGITLLDALRPQIFWASNSKHKCFSLKARPKAAQDDELGLLDLDHSVKSGGLKEVLDVYMHFLQNVEAEDAPHYGKVVARLADFLCHCVAWGGEWHDFVADHRNQVLQKAAEKFSKIKKLSYILTLLDRHMSSSGKNDKVDDITFLPPALPLQQVQTVREQLLHFSYSQKTKTPVEHGVSARGSRRRSWYQNLLEMGNEVGDAELLATLIDLDEASARLPSILSLLEDVLIEFIQATDKSVSKLVYKLLKRLLYKCPSEGSPRKITEALLKQLTSTNASQTRIAADQAARFFFFCPDLQEVVLSELFQCAPDHLQQLFKVFMTLGT